MRFANPGRGCERDRRGRACPVRCRVRRDIRHGRLRTLTGAIRSPLLLFLPVFLLAAGCAVNPVTGQRELSLLSRADEISIGEEQYRPLQQMGGGEYHVDPGVAEYVASVGQRVAAFTDRDLPYEFVVVNDGTPNAWALPGGKIGIHRGLLVELENEAELAAVLGHEVVHAAAKHGANRIQRQMLFGLAGLGVALAADDSKHARAIVGASSVGIHESGIYYGAEDEVEAGTRVLEAAPGW